MVKSTNKLLICTLKSILRVDHAVWTKVHVTARCPQNQRQYKRYVKYTFGPGGANFVFCGEALVGVAKEKEEASDDITTGDDVDDDSTDEITESSDTAIDENGSVVSGVSDEVSEDNTKKTESGWIIWVSIAAVLVIAGVVVSIVIKRKKK